MDIPFFNLRYGFESTEEFDFLNSYFKLWLENDRNTEILNLDFKTMENFNNKLQGNMSEIRELFERLNKENKRIFGYGAPAKSSTMINSIGLNNKDIDLIIEDSPLKQGLFTPGSHIPITGPNVLEKEIPDYLMIFAWNYADEIIKKVEEKYSKMNYIIPMPELRIIQNK